MLLAALLALAISDSARLVARADTTTVTVGDPVTITVRARLPAGATLLDRVPRARDTLPDGLRIMGTDTLTAGAGGWVGALHVVLFRPDTQVVPPLVVAYRTAAGATDSVVGSAIPIYVRSLLPDGNATLRDIKDIDTPLVPWRALIVGAGAFVLALAAVIAVGAVRQRRARAAVLAAERAARQRPPGPYEAALARLAALEVGDATGRYVEAAQVVRRYLAEAHAIPALERTTPELLSAVVGLNGVAAELGRVLGDADLVKFARVRPDQASAASFVTRVRDVLTLLRRRDDAVR
jgi:hypothetical protein